MYFLNRALSQAGQGVFLVGLLLLVGGSQSGAVGLSTVMVAMMAGALICALPAGALTDRMGAPGALFVGASGRLAVIVLALLLPLNPVAVGVIAFGYSAASQLFSPAELALVPAISSRRPASVHGILVTLQYTGQAAGFALLAPAAIWLGGADLAVQLSGVMYLGVVALTAMLAWRLRALAIVRATRASFSFRGPLHYFLRSSSAGYAGILLAFGELSSKALFVAIPVYINEELALGNTQQILLIAPAVAGGIAGLAWGSRSMRIQKAAPALRLCLFATVGSVIALAVLGPVVAGVARSSDWTLLSMLESSRGLSILILTPVGLLLGFCFTLTPIAGRAILTSTAPAGQHGRVFAMQGMFSDLVCILPLAVTGLSTEMAGARSTFLLVGAIGLALVVALELTRLRSMRPLVLEAPTPTRVTPA